MTKLGIAISRTVFALAEAGKLQADYVVYYGPLGLAGLKKVLQYKPVMMHDLPDPFWLNYENPFQESIMTEARAMLDAAKSPWLSTGIGASAEPQAHRDGPYREADDKDLQSREKVTENITKHGRHLAEWAGVPLALENYNYHKTNAYEYVCEPEYFNSLLEAIGADMLLDLAHARISANNMGWKSAEAYLEALPLHKVREVHVTRPGWQGKQMVDLHQPVQEEELKILGWVLDHTRDPYVTLEIDEQPEPVIIQQLDMMRRVLDGRKK